MLQAGIKQEEPLTADSRLNNENVLWSRFAEATTTESFCASWLALQCRHIHGVAGALILLGEDEQGPYKPITVWPGPMVNVQHLAPAAEKALRERRGLYIRSGQEVGTTKDLRANFHVAYPLEFSGELHGVVVLDVSYRPDHELQNVLRQLYWGAAWLEVLFLRLHEGRNADVRERLVTATDLVAVCVEQERYQAAATALVTELATKLDCDRVSYGTWHDKKIRVQALSFSSEFRKHMNLINMISSAMEEAIDQYSSIVFSTTAEDSVFVTRAHAELSRHEGMGEICTVPLIFNDKILGAITLERAGDKPFRPFEVELCESLASLVGPILEEKRKEDRWLITKAGDSFAGLAEKLLGPGHIIYKLSALLLAAVVIFFAVVDGDYRVSSDAALEGAIQRSIVAPFNGYIFEELARAGDVVREGSPLTILDDRDLKIERLKWISQKEQLTKKYREAMAEHDRAQVRIISAQMDQADAQKALVEEHLARTRILAPFDGLIISGDLSQSLGAPVERGEVLFEIAPLKDYRIVLEVGEEDIDEIAVGQKGELVLSAIPEDKLPLSIEKITPVATAREGKNFFRVEAQLQQASERLRPGMEGVAKVLVGKRKLWWIWTHDIVDWVRLKLWNLWP